MPGLYAAAPRPPRCRLPRCKGVPPPGEQRPAAQGRSAARGPTSALASKTAGFWKVKVATPEDPSRLRVSFTSGCAGGAEQEGGSA